MSNTKPWFTVPDIKGYIGVDLPLLYKNKWTEEDWTDYEIVYMDGLIDGLRVYHNDEFYKKEFGIKNGISPFFTVSYFKNSRAIGNTESYQVKPALLPLDYLIQKITIKGKTFIPLMELNRMRGVTISDDAYTFNIEKQDGQYFCAWGSIEEDRKFWYDSFTKSFYDGSPAGVSPQHDMFNKLYEWGFDIHGLIEKGFAVDITTVKELKDGFIPRTTPDIGGKDLSVL